MTYIFVFLATVLVDFGWAVYIKSLADNRVLRAACFSLFITLAGAFITINYVADHWVLIPTAAGGFVGTILSKYFTRQKES